MYTELSLEDRLALHELAARYGNVIDARAWGRLGEVFAEDGSFEMRGFGESDKRIEGRAAILAMLQGSSHPVAHHVTNVEISLDGETVRLFFKVLGTGARGRVGSADYDDVVRKDPDGWRIVTHVASLRRPPTAPA